MSSPVRTSVHLAISWLLPLVVAVALPVAGAPNRPQVVLTLANGRVVEGSAAHIGMGPDDIVVEQEKGKTETISVRDLFTGEFPGQGRWDKAPKPSLRLANGDLLRGTLAFQPDHTVLATMTWGKMTVPLDAVSAVRIKPEADLPEDMGKSAVLLGADRIEGEIKEITPDRVVAQVVGQPVPLKMDQVQALLFARKEPPPPPGDGLLVRLMLGTGERLSGRWMGFSQKNGHRSLLLRTGWGDELPIPFRYVSRLEVTNGKLIYLSDLRPSEVKETTLLARSSPFQRDRSVSGLPLRLRGRSYPRGLGVHSRSELTYALDGGFQKFSAVVGVDDAVSGAGSVRFRVYGDGKQLYESPVLRGNDAAVPIDVDIHGALLLRLEVDYADQGDLGDHADWADARLIRE
jgi:hypothetical protein